MHAKQEKAEAPQGLKDHLLQEGKGHGVALHRLATGFCDLLIERVRIYGNSCSVSRLKREGIEVDFRVARPFHWFVKKGPEQP